MLLTAAVMTVCDDDDTQDGDDKDLVPVSLEIISFPSITGLVQNSSHKFKGPWCSPDLLYVYICSSRRYPCEFSLANHI